MNLHQNKEEFAQAIQATNQYKNMREIYIEKDYWVTYVLKQLANSEYKDKVVFKGGTSLSKAFDLIERFSEDVDLALIDIAGISKNQVRNLIKNIEKTITKGFKEIPNDPKTSKKTKFRKTVYEYEKVIQDDNFAQASDKLLLEINSFTSPNPYLPKEIQSYIGQYLEQNNPQLVQEYELQPFIINVLDPKRTFVEKILGLIRVSYNENSIEELKNKIRHIYDLECLLNNQDIQDFLKSSEFFEMINTVKNDDKKNHEFDGEWLEKPLADNILFQDSAETWNKLKNTYDTNFKPLVYINGRFSQTNAIITAFTRIGNKLKEYEELKS